MRLIKKINNNYAIALDSKGEQIIVSGRGIGFQKMPCDISDLSLISRTFYDIDPNYYEFMKSVPDSVMKVTSVIVDKAEKNIQKEFNPNFIFALADHISFCITRYEKKMKINMPLAYDLLQQYPQETELGFEALELIKKECHIKLNDSEAYGIALNIINAENNIVDSTNSFNEDTILDGITSIVEKELDIKVDKKGFNYARYATHIRYLITRIKTTKQIKVRNQDIYQSIVLGRPKIYECARHCYEYIEKNLHCTLSEEEKLYLILHIDRLASREDCNQ